MRLVGQPGTIFEVDGGSIFIDFSKSSIEQEEGEQLRKNGAQTQPIGTPLTIKKSKVAMISEIEIVFNRTKASLYFLTQRNPEEVSHTEL